MSRHNTGPRTNRERTNRTLISALELRATDSEDWDLYLQYVVMLHELHYIPYQAHVKSTTGLGLTPHELVFGCLSFCSLL